MKTVLIISFYFPPFQSIGSVRPGALAKYLPGFGWDAVVLTASVCENTDPAYRVIKAFYPGDVSDVIKEKLGIKKTDKKNILPIAVQEARNPFLRKIKEYIYGIIAYPSQKKYWYSHAVKEARKILKNMKIDLILSTSNPVTAHIAAAKLKEESGIPWVADLRDLWTQDHYRSFGTLRGIVERKLEKKTLSRADALVTVSLPLAERLGALHDSKYIYAVTNGFDPEEYRETPLTPDFTITYTGSLMHGRRDPSLILRALKELFLEGKLDPRAVKLRFFGKRYAWLEKLIKQYGLEGVAFQYGEIPRAEVLKRQRESQVLLLIMWNNPMGDGVYTGKVFEYLAARRPVITAGGPEGVVSALMRQTGAGVHVSGLESLKNTFVEYYEEYRAKGAAPYGGKKEEIDKYSHYEMARKFADIFNRLA